MGSMKHISKTSVQVKVAIVGAVAAIIVAFIGNGVDSKTAKSELSTVPAKPDIEVNPTIQVNPVFNIREKPFEDAKEQVIKHGAVASDALETCLFQINPMLGKLIPRPTLENLLHNSNTLAEHLGGAAGHGNLSCVRVLLDAGAPPNGPDGGSLTTL